MEYEHILLASPLFEGIASSDLPAMLSCLGFVRKAFKKHGIIYAAGDTAFRMGVLLEGRVDIVQEDFWGNQGILSRLMPGDIFAESFVLAQAEAIPVGVMAAEDSQVLFLEYNRILHTCTNACTFHDRLIANLLSITARKNIALTQKMEHLTKRTTREKLLSYLSSQARQAGAKQFAIPYDRQALADYLAVDRSAMSAELGRMRREGMLNFHKNQFELL